MQRSRFAITRPALFSLLGAVALLFLAIAAIVSSGSASQASVPTEITPRSGTDNTVLGSWTAMGVKNRTGDDSFQDPGLNQAVYALVEYQGDIYAGGLFDDTGGGGNNEADCSDDADYPLQCIAKWDPATNAWTPVGAGLNNSVEAFVVKDDTLYVGGSFDDTAGGDGFGRCNPAPGIAWTARAAASDDSWSSVTWGGPTGGEKFVAVASAGDDTLVMTSIDGVTWSLATGSVPVNDWKSVTWGGSRFVAVAPSSDDSQVMTSSDGTNWTPHNAASDDSWTSVAYGGGKFVAVASSGDDTRAMYSSDGNSWTLASSGVAANAWSSVAYGNGKFVAVASSGDDTRVMYSSDGVSWLRPNRVPVSAWQSVAWGNNKFVAVASDGDDTQVMTSEDGIQWRSRAGSAYEDSWSSVTWAGDMFVAVASSGTRKQVMFSRDAVSWSTRTSGTVSNSWQSVTRANAGEESRADDDTIVVVGANSDDSQVMTSVAAPSPGALRCIAAWNGSSWSPLAGGVAGGVAAMAFLTDDTLLVGGGFESSTPDAYEYPELPGLVAYSSGAWTSPGQGGFDTQVFAMVRAGDDTVYIGGEYNGDVDDSGITRISTPFNDPTSFSRVGTGFSYPKAPPSSELMPGRVDALALLNGAVHAGGYFTATGDGSPALRNIASWDGTQWNTLGAGLNSDDSGTTSVRALASDDARGLLYVGGTFDDTYGGGGNGICDDTNIAVGPLRCVTVWDEGIDEFLPFQWGSDDDSNGLTGEVKAFVVDDSVVYVGGQFNTWPEGGFPKAWNLKNVGKWTWLPPTGSVNASAASGQTVTITGTRFIGVPSDGVKFGTTAVPFTRSSTESITATVPSSLASGTYTISVNGVGGWADVGTVTVSRRSGGDSTAPPVLPVPTPTPSTSPSPSATPKPTGPSIAELRAVGEVRPGSVRALAKGVPPGRSIVVVDGRKTKSDLSIGQRRMVVRTGPITLALRTKSAEGRNQRVDDGSLNIPRATRLNRDRAAALPSITMVSNGYAALTPVRVFLIPQPVGGPRGMRAKDLGYLMTNSQGQLRGKLPIRVRKVGSYIVQVNGKGPDGLVRSINLPAVVED